MSQDITQRKVTNIPPHGGTLVNRLVDEAARADLLGKAKTLPRINVSLRERCDLEMLAIGARFWWTGGGGGWWHPRRGIRCAVPADSGRRALGKWGMVW